MSESSSPDRQEPSASPIERVDLLTDDMRVRAGERRRGGRGWLATFAVFALLLAVLATGTAGFLWWQYREFYVALDAVDEETARALESMRVGNERIDERIDALSTALEAQRTRMSAVADRADALPGRLSALDQRVAALQGGAFEARGDWLRAEAEYYLALANSELALAGRWENAIAALERADRTLAELADPAVAPVREAIADDLVALQSVTLPDIEGLSFGLAGLAERIDDFPLRAARVPEGSTSSQPYEEAEPGLGRLWLGIKQALASIVRVERSDEPVEPLLSAEERRLVRKQVEVELLLARIAALDGAKQAFEGSLDAAVALLRREFDTTAPEVEGAVALLEQMRALDIAPPKPDLSVALNRLRALSAGSD